MKKIIKSFLINIIAFLIAITCYATYALNMPISSPSWETSWSIIINKFNKIFTNCPTNQVLSWFDVNTGNPVCITYN